MTVDPWLWLGFVVLVACTVEAMTGFGSIVLAIALGALVLPIPVLLPILVPLAIVMSGYLGIRYRGHVDWRLLGRLVLPWMLPGGALGYGLKPLLGGTALQTVFGLLVAGLAARSLWAAFQPRLIRRRVRRSLLLGAGISHGVFASGGPLLVLALTGAGADRAALRSTLAVIWLCLNSLLAAAYVLDGSMAAALPRIPAFLPLVAAGALLGEWLHRRVDEARFRQLVLAVLVVAGLALIVSA